MKRLVHAFWQISCGATDDRLNHFYIPELGASVRFDRTTGFFSSAALAIAAAGIVRLDRERRQDAPLVAKLCLAMALPSKLRFLPR
jgi:hypothetical protein